MHYEASYVDATSVARRAAGASPQTQGGNASLFDGGKSGGHRRADGNVLRQGLPHLTDPASLQDQGAGKQPQGIGIQAEQGKKDYEQKKRTRATSQATQTQPLLLAADAPFAAALEAIPAEDWCRTWAAGRTIMLRRTSKRVKEVVDKMRLPAVVRLSRSFWGDARNGTEAEKLQIVMRQLTLMTGCISTLELPDCDMTGQDAERLAGVLAQCPALAHLDLSSNFDFGAAGAERRWALRQHASKTLCILSFHELQCPRSLTRRKRGAFVWPHAQKANAPQRNVCCQAKQAWGKRELEKVKRPAAQNKRTRTTSQATQTQPSLLAADAPFAAALEALLPDILRCVSEVCSAGMGLGESPRSRTR